MRGKGKLRRKKIKNVRSKKKRSALDQRTPGAVRKKTKKKKKKKSQEVVLQKKKNSYRTASKGGCRLLGRGAGKPPGNDCFLPTRSSLRKEGKRLLIRKAASLCCQQKKKKKQIEEGSRTRRGRSIMTSFPRMNRRPRSQPEKMKTGAKTTNLRGAHTRQKACAPRDPE